MEDSLNDVLAPLNNNKKLKTFFNTSDVLNGNRGLGRKECTALKVNEAEVWVGVNNGENEIYVSA